MMMTKHLNDLREYLNELSKINEVQPIDQEVDLFLEAGAIIRRSYDLKAPAPLMSNLKYKNTKLNNGLRVLGASAGASRQPKLFLTRVAISLGLEPDATSQEIIEALVKLQCSTPIKPEIVSTGPCKENIFLGEKVDLEQLPAPQINQNDGGRYLNTFGTIVAKSVDGQWVNWGIARIMLLDKKRCVANVVPGQDTRKIQEEWFSQGKNMPVAIFQGGPPVIPFVSGMGVPSGVSERDLIGGYLGHPLQLVKCETVDLEVPATAEIVIEGEFSATEKAMEGPMGEFSGSICLASKNYNPVINVSAISYRNEGILPVVAGGYPIEENHSCWALGMSSKIYADLKNAGLPVTQCFIPFESAVHWLVITVDRNYIWHKKNRGKYSINTLIDEFKKVLFKIKPAIWMTKILIMADDIDASNINDVVWAFATRCHPDQHLLFPNEDLPMPLVGFLSDAEKKSLKCPKIIYNCLRPETWSKEEIPTPAKFETNWPKDIQEKVLKNWSEYGYTDLL
ncbi:UbiD family decarboxylase [Legionella clemsonensis]|nr:UbiD family decarboxylase [Legionella clemsonensis]